MASQFNSREIVLKVRANPEPFKDALRRDFIDQKLVAQVTEAIQAKGDGDTRVEFLDILATEHLLDVYKAHFQYHDTLGSRYLQWAVEKKLCEQFGVPFDAPEPRYREAPADLAFTTMKYEWLAAKDAETRVQLRAVGKAMDAALRAGTLRVVPRPQRVIKRGPKPRPKKVTKTSAGPAPQDGSEAQAKPKADLRGKGKEVVAGPVPKMDH